MKRYYLTWFLRGSHVPHKMPSPPIKVLPPSPKILIISPLNGCLLDWWCFLNLLGSNETLLVKLKFFDWEQY